MDRIDEVLEYWFQGWDDAAPGPASPASARWFGKALETDREIKARFEEDHLQAARGELHVWEATPRGRLALVILLDQFPRNMYRGTPHMFATDPLALDLARRTVDEGLDGSLRPVERMFLYLPLMHSESVEVHVQARALYARLQAEGAAAVPTLAGFLAFVCEYERKHAVIIERFGRYPHRNAILGRRSTPEELTFLQGPDSSF